MDVIIVGGGIGGLTLALMLHRAGVGCRVYEAAPEIKPIGVGINILPHATRELSALGLEPALAQVGVTTADACFFNRFGQLIYREPLGRHAGYDWPQFSLHRGDLQRVLLDACLERLGSDRVRTNWHCTGVEQDSTGATAHFRSMDGNAELPPQRGAAVIACDGINSVIRKQFYPDEGAPIYSGINMWRGVTRWQPILSGACMIRAGWFTSAKLVVYPIRNNVDARGRQLVNWLVEIATPHYRHRDWNRSGTIEEFITPVKDWHFDWLDVPAFLRAADLILEYPMVDQDPLPRWSFERVTLLGDAAHPMYPRGSNGAGQAILDAKALAGCLAGGADPAAALAQYDALRREATANVVRMNRSSPPDAILREIHQRTGDRPFDDIDKVISRAELEALSDGYKRVAGYDRATLGSAR
ncbi:MAG TPA: flavin-dependent oxidoreductase [Burkholderiales bacterium]|nr:flavin-dependent oxidoreductase [Burkholderiales bacterium]